jgi:[protein-PII] uridylyltransferase
VREHLTLSEFATGKDPADPAVAEDLAARVDYDPLTLDMLFDLTRADGSSLGATANEAITKKYGWSRWRERLVRAMADAARARMPRS